MIAVIIIALIIVIILLIDMMNRSFLISQFRRNNIIVFGKKGRGKDFLFSAIMYLRKEQFSANIDYGQPKEKIRPINYYSVAPNTFEELINDQVQIIEKKFEEKEDYYISDGGNFLPSQYDSKLDKLYPSLPIVYSLSRHLGNFNIHINTQALGRVWKKLREQADGYIMARGIIHLPRYSIHFSRYYEMYDTAEKGMKPYKSPLLNKYAKSEQIAFETQYGKIKNLFIIIDRKKIKYDTRYFHRVFYGKVAPSKKDSLQKHKTHKHGG